MKQELKPCPFCGNKDVYIEKNMRGITHISCKLVNVGCSSEFYFFGADTEEEITQRWNTRPDHSGETTEMIQGKTLTTEISESQMRYEIAKDFATQTLAIMMNDPSSANLSPLVMEMTIQGTCKGAVNIADELINQLKKQSDE